MGFAVAIGVVRFVRKTTEEELYSVGFNRKLRDSGINPSEEHQPWLPPRLVHPEMKGSRHPQTCSIPCPSTSLRCFQKR